MWGLYRWLWHSLNQDYFEIPEAPWEKRVISCHVVFTSHVSCHVRWISSQASATSAWSTWGTNVGMAAARLWATRHGESMGGGFPLDYSAYSAYIGPIHRTVTREWQVHPLLGHLSGSTLEAGEPASSGMVWDLCLDLWPMASHVIP